MGRPPTDDVRFPDHPARDAAIKRARAGALAELRRTPIAPSWRRQALTVIAVVTGVTALGAAFVAFHKGLAPAFAGRVPGLVLLATAQVCGLWAALSPRRSPAGGLAWISAALGAGAVLIARGATGESPLPGWTCSASHVATALGPLIVVVLALRQSAWSAGRVLTAGLAVGVAGPIWGEVTCERGVAHAALHHGGSWLIIAAACYVLSRRLTRRSFAP